MITIIFPFRNREVHRIKRSINSLKLQWNFDFSVFFIDYGSHEDTSKEVELFLNDYNFVHYKYLYTQNQPWNKSKAINSALKNVVTPFCFVADIDMIFHDEFISTLYNKLNLNKVTYFQVGFLSKEESKKDISFENYKIKFLSNGQATGMSLFPVEKLNLIEGFDEFYHFWGAEDADIHKRLKLIGCEIEFYDEKVLMLHQWHPTYRNREATSLTTDLQLSSIVTLNYKHLRRYEICHNIINEQADWATLVDKKKFEALDREPVTYTILNVSAAVTHFLFIELPKFHGRILKVRFEEDPYGKTFEYYIKRFLGKKVPQYCTLKEINDQVLLHIISFYHHYPYSYQVTPDLKSITFAIKK